MDDVTEKTENRLRAIDTLNRMYGEYLIRTENTNKDSVQLDDKTIDALISSSNDV